MPAVRQLRTAALTPCNNEFASLMLIDAGSAGKEGPCGALSPLRFAPLLCYGGKLWVHSSPPTARWRPLPHFRVRGGGGRRQAGVPPSPACTCCRGVPRPVASNAHPAASRHGLLRSPRAASQSRTAPTGPRGPLASRLCPCGASRGCFAASRPLPSCFAAATRQSRPGPTRIASASVCPHWRRQGCGVPHKNRGTDFCKPLTPPARARASGNAMRVGSHDGKERRPQPIPRLVRVATEWA